jgi:hypothetical protein
MESSSSHWSQREYTMRRERYGYMPRHERSRTLPVIAVVTALLGTVSACCKSDLPELAAEDRYLSRLIEQVPVPAAAHAEPWVDAPTVELVGDRITVDGTQAGRLGSSTGTEELQSLLKAKRQLWQQINPGRAFPGLAKFAAARDTPGSKVVAIARAAAKAGFPKLGVVVHAVDKGKLSPDSLGIAIVRVRVRKAEDPGTEPDGLRLMLGPGNMAVQSWKKGNTESPAEPVAMTDEKDADGTIRLPGLRAAVGRAGGEHPNEQRLAIIAGMKHLSLAKLVGVTDVFREPKAGFETLYVIHE